MLAHKEAPGPPLGWLAGDRALVVMQDEDSSPPGARLSTRTDTVCNRGQNEARSLRPFGPSVASESNTLRCSFSDCDGPNVIARPEIEAGAPPLCADCLAERAGWEPIR